MAYKGKYTSFDIDPTRNIVPERKLHDILESNVGDEFDVNVEFPAEYHAENLAGKPAVFKVKLNEIKTRELPAIDDEFAKDVSEFDTIADLKADLKA